MLASTLLIYAVSSGAEVRLNTGTGADYRLGIMSWSEIPFRSVVRQRYDFSCGSAAVATLLSYHYGHMTPEGPVFSAMWDAGDKPTIKRLGFSMLDMKQYLDGIGLPTAGYRLSLERLRRLERPGIVLLDLNGYKHFVVVKGATRGEMLVGDPMLGLTRYSAREFASHWNGIFLMILGDNGGHRPGFNLASDWGRWAAAPTDIARDDRSIGRLTDHLPPFYQITVQTLANTRIISGR